MILKLEEGTTVDDMGLRESVDCVGRWREIPDSAQDMDPRASSDFLDGEVVSMDNNEHQSAAKYFINNKPPEELFLVRHFSEDSGLGRIRIAFHKVTRARELSQFNSRHFCPNMV
jgi:hypothetical protein